MTLTGEDCHCIDESYFPCQQCPRKYDVTTSMNYRQQNNDIRFKSHALKITHNRSFVVPKLEYLVPTYSLRCPFQYEFYRFVQAKIFLSKVKSSLSFINTSSDFNMWAILKKHFSLTSIRSLSY